MPSTVQVGPFRYTVFCDYEHIAVHRYEYEENALGRCSGDDLRILVDPARPADKQADVLLHEVLHAVWWMANLPAEPSKGEEPEKLTQEQVIKALSAPLLDTLRRNPDLVAYLVAAGETSG